MKESMEDYIDISSIIKSMKGFDENHLSNTSLAITFEKWSTEEDAQRQIAQASTKKANVSIERHGAYIQCQLEFSTHVDKDLNQIYHILEMFGQECEKMNENDTEVPMIIFSFLPELSNGEYYVTAINPIFWNIQPSSPSSINNNILRIQFLEEQFAFYKTDAIDMNGIQNDVERENNYRVNLEIQDANEKQKHLDRLDREEEMRQL